ncbi:hypothetical protein [Paenibacillus lactis]
MEAQRQSPAWLQRQEPGFLWRRGAVAALLSEPWGGAYIGFGRC